MTFKASQIRSSKYSHRAWTWGTPTATNGRDYGGFGLYVRSMWFCTECRIRKPIPRQVRNDSCPGFAVALWGCVRWMIIGGIRMRSVECDERGTKLVAVIHVWQDGRRVSRRVSRTESTGHHPNLSRVCEWALTGTLPCPAARKPSYQRGELGSLGQTSVRT